MSSGAGEASGAGGLDLNCDTVGILENHEDGVEGGLEDGLVSTGGELPAKENGETADRGAEEEKECKRGIADWEDGMVGSGDGSAGSELGGRSEVGVVETVITEAGAESHGGKLLETEFGKKGSAGLVSVLTVGIEDVDASSQTMNLGDGTGSDQKRGSDEMATDEGSLTVLIGGGGIEDERLEGSSILRREQAEFQLDLVDGGGELVDGQLDLEEREPKGESLTVKLSEVDSREKEITDMFTVAAEKFEATDASNQALRLVNVSGGDKKQGIDLYMEGMVIDRQAGPGESKAEVLSHSGKLLEAETGEDGSAELVVVSTQAFEPVEAIIHPVDLPVEASGLVGSDDDQSRVADENKEDMVGTDKDLHGGAGGENLEGSSNLTETVGVGLVDGDVQVVDFEFVPEDREANGESLGAKLSKMDTGVGQIAVLVAVSTEEFESVEAGDQPVMEIDRGGNDSADLIAVSAEEFEAVLAGNQAMNLGDGSGGDQKQGIDFDAEGMVTDGQLDPGERSAEVKSLCGNFLEVDKRGEGSAVLVSVSTEEFQPVEASRHPMDFHDGSGGDEKRGTDLDVEGMVIDGESGSGKSVVESSGGKLLEIDRVEKGNTVLVSVSTERFEHDKICCQTMDFCDGSGYDQRLGTDLDAHGMVVISEDSVAVSVGIGGKLLEVECEEKISPELVDGSTEGFESAKVISQAINLLHSSTDDQRLGTDVVGESVVSVKEASVTISVGSGRPKDERSQLLLVSRKEQAEVQGDLGDGIDQTADVEVDTGKRHAESNSCSGRHVAAVMEEKSSAKLVGASAEPSEAADASSQAMNLADGYVGDPMQVADVDAEGLIRTDEVSPNVLVVGGEADNEKMEGSSISREQLEVRVDLVDGSDKAGGQLGCGEGEEEVDSQEGMPLELQTGEKENADPVAPSAEDFDVIEASNQAVISVDGSSGDQIQAIDADAEGMDLDAQLSPRGRDAEVNSQNRKHLEVDKRGEEGAKSVAVSTEIFEPTEASSQAMDFGDESNGDEKRGIDVNAEGIANDTELSPGKSVAEIEIHGEKILEVGRNNEGSVEMPAFSTEGVLRSKVSSEPVDLVDGCGGEQMLETEVDAEAMVRTDEDSVFISIASGTPEDSRLEGSLNLRKELEVVQGNLAERIGEALLGELGTAISLAEVKSYGEKCMAVDMGEKGSTKLISASTERPESVEASGQAMDLVDDSTSDQIQGTDVDGEGMVGIEHKDTVLVVDGSQVNERLEGSLTLGEKKVEFPVHLVEECGQVENELDSHGGRLWEVELGKKSKGLVAVSAGRFEAVEVSCKAAELLDRSCIGDISDDSAGDGGGGPEIERLDEESSVLGIDHVEASLQKSMDGCIQVVDNELIRGERTPFLESHDGKLLKTEAEVKEGVEPLAFSAEGFEAAEACSQTMDREHGFGGDQKPETFLDPEHAVGTNGGSFNISGAGGGPEDESLERSLLLGEEHTEVLQDLVDGHDQVCYQVLDGEFYSGKRESEVEHHSGKLFEPEVKEKVSAVLTSVAAGGSCALDASSEDMDLEDKCSSEQKQETNAEAECMVGTDVDSVVVSVDGGGLEDETLKASTNLVEEIEIGEETNGTGSTVKDLSESMYSESAGYDTMMHAAQVQNEFGGGQRHGTGLGSEDMVGGTEQAYLSVSVGGGDPEDERLETSYRFGKKQLDAGPGMQEKNLAHPEKIGGDGVYDENNTLAGETVQKLDSIPITEEQDSGSQQADGDMKSTVVSVSTVGGSDFAKTAMVLDAAVNVEAGSSDEHATVDIMVEKGNVLLEDNGSVMSVTPVELQNRDAEINFDHQKDKIDSSPLMVSCTENEAHASDPHSYGNFFFEKGNSITEDSNSLLGIGMPKSSAGCQDVQTTNTSSREYNQSELEQGTPSLETSLHDVDETIDCSQKLQDGTPENLKELENCSDGSDGKSTESASTSQQATYYLSFPEKEVFSTSDLVWGKVKSHPWWPGQIFDLSGASPLAIKYQKKDHFLVAYFGDKTFAWCEESRLKPFLFCFSQMEKQTSSDSFLRALHDILVEISRRVELSMTCSCLPEEAYADVKYQKVENAGVRGKTVNPVFDRCEFVNYFHAEHLLDYVKELAQVPNGGADRLELIVARAQLKAFYLSKGYTELPVFTNGSGLVENDIETPSSISEKLNEDDLEQSTTLSDLFSTKGKLRGRDGTLAKQKQFVEDGRKQKSLSELMEEETTFLLVNRYENASEVQDDENCLSSGNKRKALDHVSSDIGRSKTKKIDLQADEEAKLPSPTSNSSFKVGEFISRAASKLTSGQPIRKCHGEASERGLSKTDDWSIDYMDLDDFLDIPFEHPKLQIDISVDYPPANEMLSKLCLAARNPLKGNNFSSIVLSFFCTFRNVQVANISIEKNETEKPRAKRGRKKKIILDLESPDMSTPDHMKDSYWSDMIIPEKDALFNPPKRRGRKKRKFIDESSSTLILNLPSDCEPKLLTGTVCPHVKHILTAERPIISVEEKIVDERTPTAVILYFNSSNSLPSDMELIRIFSRYGPLKEEETYIERKNNSAMVVFKKRTDAEMAFSSAGKFSTFGPALLSYRLKHFPYKSSPVNALIGEDDATQIKDDQLGSLAEPEFNGALDGKLSEAVDKESSIFVQSQGQFGPVLDKSPGEFSELSESQVGDAVVSDATPVNTERKEPPSQDVPAQMETGSVSDHQLLEPLDQEFSYFDLDQAEAGDVPGTEVTGGDETLEVPQDEQSFDTVAKSPEQVAVTGTSDSLADQLENGIVLETTTQLEAVSQEFSCSASPAEDKDIPNEFNIGTSSQIVSEEREVAIESDSTQVELERQDPSGSDTKVEPAGMPSHATEVCVSEQRII